MSGGGAETGATGVQAVVITGRDRFGGGADGGLGGVTDGGGGRIHKGRRQGQTKLVGR